MSKRSFVLITPNCLSIVIISLLCIIGLCYQYSTTTNGYNYNNGLHLEIKSTTEYQLQENIKIYNDQLSIPPQICVKPTKTDHHARAPLNVDHYIHILYCTDLAYTVPMYVSMNSILHNSEHHSRLYFHILIEKKAHLPQINTALNELLGGNIKYEVKCLEKHLYSNNLHIINHIAHQTQRNNHLRKKMNVARFYLPLIFANIDFALYIDPDTVIQGDIAELWDTHVTKGTALWAVHNERCAMNQKTIPSFKRYLKTLNRYCNHTMFNLAPLKVKHYHRKTKWFNAGVVLYDLEFWRRNEMTSKSEYLLQIQDHFNRESGSRLWFWFTQSIMNILYSFGVHVAIGHLNITWNYGVIGGGRTRMVRNPKLIHYKGKFKPWSNKSRADNPFYAIWHQYLPRNMSVAIN